MATTGAVIQEPVLPLGAAAEDVLSVDVGGVPTAFTVTSDRRALKLGGGLPVTTTDVWVEYQRRTTPARGAISH